MCVRAALVHAKVEIEPGDTMRNMMLVGETAKRKKERECGTMYENLGAGKASVSINVKSAEGRKALVEMLKSADVFISNVRPVKMHAGPPT